VVYIEFMLKTLIIPNHDHLQSGILLYPLRMIILL